MKKIQIKLALVAMLVTVTGVGYAQCYKNTNVDCVSQCQAACGFATATWSAGSKPQASTQGTGTGYNQTLRNSNGTCYCQGQWMDPFLSIHPYNDTCGPIDNDVADTGSTTCNMIGGG